MRISPASTSTQCDHVRQHFRTKHVNHTTDSTQRKTSCIGVQCCMKTTRPALGLIRVLVCPTCSPRPLARRLLRLNDVLHDCLPVSATCDGELSCHHLWWWSRNSLACGDRGSWVVARQFLGWSPVDKEREKVRMWWQWLSVGCEAPLPCELRDVVGSLTAVVCAVL